MPAQLLQVDLLQELLDRRGAHARAERLGEVDADAFRRDIEHPAHHPVLRLGDELLLIFVLKELQALGELLGLILGVPLLQALAIHLEGALLGALLVGQLLIGKLFLQLGLERGDMLVASRLFLADLIRYRFLDRVPMLLEKRPIHMGDDVGDEVEHLLERARRHVENKAHRAGHALEVPGMRDGRGQFDMPHPLTADFRPRHFSATPVADNPLEFDLLIAAAVTLPVLHRAENALTEKPVTLRLERAVVYCLRLLDLSGRPGPDLLWGGDTDSYLVEVRAVGHTYSFPNGGSDVRVRGSATASRPPRRRVRPEPPTPEP